MAYTKQLWDDGEAAGTPLSADRLNFIEQGIENAQLVATQALDSVTGNFTGTASDDRLSVLAVPQRFSGIDPSGVSDTRAGLQAAVSATPPGGVLVIPAGLYLLNGRVVVTNPITIWAYGAIFLNNSTQEVFVFNGAYESIYSVSASVEGTVTGSAGETLNVTTLTLSGSPAWLTGDVVKVVADNLLPDPQVGAKPGQHMIVVSASGSTVMVAGKFRDPMTTSVRVARKKRLGFALFGGTTTATASLMSATANGNAQIKFFSSIRPVIRDHQVLNAAGPGILMDDCYEYYVDRLCLDYLKNGNTIDNTYGYGVNDQSSEYGLVSALRASRVRHGFTCNGGSAATLGPLDDYGRSYGTDVANGRVYGSTQSAWDTHGNGQRIRFLNCQAIDCYNGFNFRGREMVVLGGYVRNPRLFGVGCFATPNGKSFGHYFGGGLVIENPGDHAINITTNTGGSYAGVKETNPCYVDDVTVIGLASGKKALNAVNSTVHVGRIKTTVAGFNSNNSDVLPVPTLTV